jgi:hypothetical protein
MPISHTIRQKIAEATAKKFIRRAAGFYADAQNYPDCGIDYLRKARVAEWRAHCWNGVAEFEARVVKHPDNGDEYAEKAEALREKVLATTNIEGE